VVSLQTEGNNKTAFYSNWKSIGNANAAGLLGALIVMCSILAVTTPYFFSVENGLNILRAVSFIGIAAAAATLVLVSGGIDLSMAATMALAGTVSGGLIEAGYSLPIAIFAGLAAGGIVGVVNAVIIVNFGINPLIATIGTQFAARGAAYLVVNSREVFIMDPAFNWVGQATIFTFPVSGILMLLVFAFFGWLMRDTIFGRQIYAIGGTPNGTSALLSGVPVKRRMFQVYVISGFSSAVAGLLLSSYSNTATGYNAMGLELPILAAVILGGTALGGGRGTVWGTLAGVLLVGVITNGLTLNNAPLAWVLVVQGAILVIAVVIDDRRQARYDR
jgi:ribose transport system permease protein